MVAFVQRFGSLSTTTSKLGTMLLFAKVHLCLSHLPGDIMYCPSNTQTASLYHLSHNSSLWKPVSCTAM